MDDWPGAAGAQNEQRAAGHHAVGPGVEGAHRRHVRRRQAATGGETIATSRHHRRLIPQVAAGVDADAGAIIAARHRQTGRHRRRVVRIRRVFVRHGRHYRSRTLHDTNRIVNIFLFVCAASSTCQRQSPGPPKGSTGSAQLHSSSFNESVEALSTGSTEVSRVSARGPPV